MIHVASRPGPPLPSKRRTRNIVVPHTPLPLMGEATPILETPENLGLSADTDPDCDWPGRPDSAPPSFRRPASNKIELPARPRRILDIGVPMGPARPCVCQTQQRFRMIIEYKEEPWLGCAHYLLEGVTHTVVEGETQQARPAGACRCHTTPSWYSSASPSHTSHPTPALPSAASSRLDISAAKEEEYAPLLDLAALEVTPKTMRPLLKEFSDATKERFAIEQKQHDEAADRKRKGVEVVPRYFEKGLDGGYRVLTPAGRADAGVNDPPTRRTHDNICGKAPGSALHPSGHDHDQKTRKKGCPALSKMSSARA
ncbi:hypothetical protein B0H19DRAFT_1253263 [Mycena capillaripes]|nr:hypothetical protein B0H19DRAFT_1253263 [Mycena capillaripes]